MGRQFTYLEALSGCRCIDDRHRGYGQWWTGGPAGGVGARPARLLEDTSGYLRSACEQQCINGAVY
ncbi:hypothetical protein BRADI_2g41945v3 [Brachypodium distachyon]|uniref:Uncharacterized protein n=1 Tax=Brachypodium distachyon TaxID=15368 RepID=A0A2K2DDA8_BRADI|nr:hypothetical protein BRADI_2g41945v3 [Brachypodium distachyon]